MFQLDMECRIITVFQGLKRIIKNKQKAKTSLTGSNPQKNRYNNGWVTRRGKGSSKPHLGRG